MCVCVCVCLGRSLAHRRRPRLVRDFLFVYLLILKKTGSKHADITVSQDKGWGCWGQEQPTEQNIHTLFKGFWAIWTQSSWFRCGFSHTFFSPLKVHLISFGFSYRGERQSRRPKRLVSAWKSHFQSIYSHDSDPNFYSYTHSNTLLYVPVGAPEPTEQTLNSYAAQSAPQQAVCLPCERQRGE